MNNTKAAKQMLIGKSCYNCKHKIVVGGDNLWEGSERDFCGVKSLVYDITGKLDKNYICSSWEKE